jgi:23S rRNA (uracil1939-C5)-methyltransferase
MKQPRIHQRVTMSHIVGGGQTMGELADGRKVFAWGALPGETADIQETKRKSRYCEGIAVAIEQESSERVVPRDPDSYLSTSPWQIMTSEAEQHYKAALIEEAFELHDIVLPEVIDVYTDGREYEYRNKIEYSWWWDNERDRLDLAFFRRGTHGKIPVEGTSLARTEISEAALRIRDVLRTRGTSAYDLKTLLVRCNNDGQVAAQLYVKEREFTPLTDAEITAMDIVGFELIYSNPKSPASVITERLQQWGVVALTDTILGVPFTYATEGFFQINLPVYEQALKDMREWVGDIQKRVIDLYSGVGSIGLTIGGEDVTLIESNEHAVREMERNIATLGRSESAQAVLAPSEKAIEHITDDAMIIVDPPRAGLHEDVVKRLLDVQPERIIYLSCNPVTQARDVARLAEGYGIRAHRGYNFFPRTPHIEHLVVLDKK